MSVQSTLMHT